MKDQKDNLDGYGTQGHLLSKNEKGENAHQESWQPREQVGACVTSLLTISFYL